jgi:alkylmercury lyase
MTMMRAEELRRVWQQRRQLPALHEQVLWEAFRLLCRGRVATDTTLAAHTGLSPEVVRSALVALQADGRLVHAVEAGGVVGAFGLSVLPTSHALTLDGRQLFAWCALDAAGIPAGLAVDATVHSQCLTCHQGLTIVYDTGTVTHAVPSAMRLWVAAPEMGHSVVGDT